VDLKSHIDVAGPVLTFAQTGWTGLVAKTIQLFGLLDPERALDAGKSAAFARTAPEREELHVS